MEYRYLIPNFVTFMKLYGCSFLVFTYWINPLPVNIGFVLSTLFFAYFLFDEMDGWLARRLDACSKFGAVFDNYTDRFADTLFCIYFIHAGSMNIGIFLLLLVRLCLNDAWDGTGHTWWLMTLWSFGKAVFWACMFLNAPTWAINTMTLVIVYGVFDYVRLLGKRMYGTSNQS
jgi:phosphatidylserine synthase